MNQEQTIPDGHITLREAAKISGYAPDYVGQLIRKGRLYGRQIYMNVAWVTTEEAVRGYMSQSTSKDDTSTTPTEGIRERWRAFENRVFSEARLSILLKTLLYFGLVLSVILSLFLVAVLAVTLDRSLERQALERLERGYEVRP